MTPYTLIEKKTLDRTAFIDHETRFNATAIMWNSNILKHRVAPGSIDEFHILLSITETVLEKLRIAATENKVSNKTLS